MAANIQTAQAQNAKPRKRSRDPLIAEKQKIYDFVKNSGATRWNDLFAMEGFTTMYNELIDLVGSGEASVGKDQNRAESYIASGCAVLERKQSRGAARKPRRKDFEDAASLIHKGLMLMPTLQGDANNPVIEKTLESAYKALAQIYNSDNLKNQSRFEMYSMLWLRQCAPKYTDRRHLVEVQYNAQALFESYGRTMKNQMKRLASMGQSGNSGMHRQMSKLVAEIRRVRAKAEECLLAEAIADFQTRPRLFSILLSQYKEIKSTLNRDFSVFDSFQLQSPLEFNKEKQARLNAIAADPVQAAKKTPPPVTNIFTNVVLDFEQNCLRARRPINSGRIIFYEPVIAASWANASQHCGQCCKPLPFGGIPCSKCSRVSFCTERCLFFTQDSSCKVPINRHGDLNCTNFKGFKLGKSSALAYDLLTKSCSKLALFAQAISQPGTEYNIRPLNEQAISSDLALNMAVVLICKRADQLQASDNGSVLLDPWLVAETIHLLLTLAKFPEFLGQNANRVPLTILLYKILYYFKISPQANVYLDRSKGGVALGAFGGGMLEYSCLPNTRRQLNTKTGSIEYVALRKIEPGEILTVARSSKKAAPKGNQLKYELDKYLLTCSCRKCSQPPP